MKLLLGVCGGIAAYKAAELTRELQRRNAQVQIVLTSGAERFITALTLATLSGRQVVTSLWRPATEEIAAGHPEPFDIEHIQLAQQADCILVAPATADMIAKLAHGHASDPLSTICLASTAPLLLAPAMNVHMWQHPATQENLATLRRRGARIIAPGSGALACGMIGEGRLAEPSEIADAVWAALPRTRDLQGETILITAGGTREPIDAVRFLGNRSSGKMGWALTEACLARGATVIQISTVGTGEASLRCEQIAVNTAAEMQDAVLAQLPRASIVIMAAAVADYRVLQPSTGKVKKRQTLTLELVQNDDILRQVVLHRRPGTLVVGFAAETESLLEEGRRKLREKGVDLLIANDVSHVESGFGSDYNTGLLLTPDQEVTLPLSTKREMAETILDYVQSARKVRKA